jgi:osmotically inducible lipoprotein OsmB
MTKYVLALFLASGVIAGCGTTNETFGTLGGAAVGGVAGNAVGRGSTAATIGGAAVGGIVGHEVGQAADRRR